MKMVEKYRGPIAAVKAQFPGIALPDDKLEKMLTAAHESRTLNDIDKVPSIWAGLTSLFPLTDYEEALYFNLSGIYASLFYLAAKACEVKYTVSIRSINFRGDTYAWIIFSRGGGNKTYHPLSYIAKAFENNELQEIPGSELLYQFEEELF